MVDHKVMGQSECLRYLVWFKNREDTNKYAGLVRFVDNSPCNMNVEEKIFWTSFGSIFGLRPPLFFEVYVYTNIEFSDKTWFIGAKTDYYM
jgi:hypothetical protein